MQLSQKRKIISDFFSFAFSKLTFNFEFFQKKDDANSGSAFELTDSEERA